MNRKFFLLLVLLISYEFAFTQNLLKGPQKIVIDAKRNRLLVSNYDSGDIVQIDSNGKQSYFYQNAGFVDGIEIVGDIVYGVGNNRKILGYDLRKPRKVFDINIPGDPEQYLSSICSDSNGHLFVSCPKLNAIYRIRLSDGAYSVFAKGNGLNRPNGILLENEKNRIVVIDDSPAPSLIHSISLIDSIVTTLKSTAFDRPDGIVRDKLGNYFIGGYYLQGLYKINSDFNGDFELFYKGNNIVYPTYDSRNNSLLVTFYNSNSWGKIPLPATHVENDLIKTAGPFMGQAIPDTSLQLFAPGFVSTGLDEGVITSAPDGKECFWSISFTGLETILTSKLVNGEWTKPEIAPFAGKYYDGWPAIQADGKRMFFHSSRPVADASTGITAKFNIWYRDRIDKEWSEPQLVNAPVNGAENSTCPSVTMSGTLYISKRFSDGTEKLCRSELRNGVYQQLEILPDNVNVLKDNYHGYISPDESYFIRICYGRPDNIGAGWNYYITFRKSEGTWSDLVNLGKEVNSVYCGGAPSISPDGKYLFFQGIAATSITDSLDRKYTLEELIDLDVKSPQKGSTDIYWISTKIIEELRLKENILK